MMTVNAMSHKTHPVDDNNCLFGEIGDRQSGGGWLLLIVIHGGPQMNEW